jgi:2-iminobutanoate/2-iminopropanoate deaminase
MTLRQLARVWLMVVLAATGACKNTPTTSGLPWWPQGPGNPPGSEQEPTTEQRAQPVSTTKTAKTVPAAPITATEAPQSEARPAAAANSDAQATRYGDLLFLSGQTAAASGDIAQQTHAAMQKIGTILDSHRLTMANIVHVTVQLANIKDLQAMDAAYASHFRSIPPARTVAEVAHLPADALVQITVIAGR